MSHPTTHRYMLTLAHLGYLERGAKRKYRLALCVTDLGMSALSSTSLYEHAQPHMEGLCGQTGFAISIAVLDGQEILLVDRLRGSRRGQQHIDLGLAPGGRLPLHCTAMGKLLLAHLPVNVQRDLINELALSKDTPNTITSKRALRTELERIREEGLATSDEEMAPGLVSIAVSIRRDSEEVCAALSMTAHTSMISLEDLVAHLAPHLISAAGRISARLGYRRADELGGSVDRQGLALAAE
jgi:IclR family pca regulon transcriptional regulator